MKAFSGEFHSKPAKVRGQVDHITFQNEENGYVVARLIPDDHPVPVTIVGVIPGLKVGEYLEIEGEWKRHPKFGPQVEVEKFKPLMPATIKGIEAYLGSGMISGIGPANAKKIVKHFKKDTIAILTTNPERVTEVPGIGKVKAASIIKSWREGAAIRDTMMFLQEHMISPKIAIRIIREYGDNALNRLRENPYRLADDVFGIGFKKADEVAQKLGVPINDPRRLEGAVKYILNLALNEGHCYLDMQAIVEKGVELLDLQPQDVESIIADIIQKEDLKKDEEAIYLPAYYVSEENVSKLVSRKLASPPNPLDDKEMYKLLEIEEARAGYKLNDQQSKAVIQSLNSPFMVLTGGPGTGKSTAMHFLVRIAERLKKRVLMASPTGRAAKRLEETTGRSASTIHRLLEYNPSVPGKFVKNEQNKLDGDLLIIDEASMIDLILFYNLMKAIPPEMQILLVGDPDQLPSVGAGNVLSDILGVRDVDRIRLTQIFRQAEKSMIVQNAHRVITGRKMLYEPMPNMEKDFRFMEENEPEKAARMIIDVIQSKFSEKVDPIRDIQVLTPMHMGPVGAKNLNNVLQETLNPLQSKIDELDYYGRKFRIGDRVMQIKNNYDKEVFNGDVGFIENVDTVNGQIDIIYDRKVTYKSGDLDELAHAYAITIHKSQGSEYPVVIMPILTTHYIMLRRNLLYTGLTRAKKLVVIIGSKMALDIAIKRDDVGHRNTKLTERILNYVGMSFS
jgi:exodeoxyribonuclease V alpha subunit